MKAKLVFSDGAIKLGQGVREIFEITAALEADFDFQTAAGQTGKMVLIGRDLAKYNFEGSLLKAIQRI